jgi:hypothetical protein
MHTSGYLCRYILYIFMSGGSVMAYSVEVDSGITTIESHHTIEQTMERLQTSLETHKVRIFATIGFSGASLRWVGGPR